MYIKICLLTLNLVWKTTTNGILWPGVEVKMYFVKINHNTSHGVYAAFIA